METILKSDSQTRVFYSVVGSMRMSRLLSFAPTIALLLFIVGLPRVAWCQAAPASDPKCYASLKQAKLVTPNSGWAIVDQPMDHPPASAAYTEDCVSDHLYWTADSGRTWTEITPPRMPTKNFGLVCFLDDTHGWLVSFDTDHEESVGPLYVLFTTDGGRHWNSNIIKPATVGSITEMRPISVFFSDPDHGWILWHWAEMNSRASALTATSDGGRTWKLLPQPPGPGPMEFISARQGWLVGASPDQVGIPITEADQLWATHDGGENWSPVSVPVPAKAGQDVRFGAFNFNSAGDGVLVATQPVSSSAQRIFTCVTHDGGKTWQFDHFDQDGSQADPSTFGTRVVWSIFPWPSAPTRIRTGDNEILPLLPEALSPEGPLGDVGFVDASRAWAMFSNGRTGPFTSQILFELLATVDGGKTFQTITPPVATHYPISPPQLFTLNGTILRFPPRSAFALRPPPLPLNGGCLLRFRPPVGGPILITGTGFLHKNTVWLGSHLIPAASEDGKNLRLLVPADVIPGTYELFVQNISGKTDEVEITIRPAEHLRVTNIQDGEPIHPGQTIFLIGSGFLLENTVWFGEQSVPAKLVITGASTLELDVPSSIPLGTCEIRVSNALGQSDPVSVVVE
jgi:photosystem II stability/assembly factor-like uncharacterized protein